MTQKDLILEVLLRNSDDWIVSHQLIKTDTPWGYIGIDGLRRCRDLVAEGKIESKLGREIGKDPRFVYYRIKKLVTLDEALTKGLI